ncbi:MAG TPA: hypothetical protein VKK61_09115 [Tepidisphaeraceae bacterium]|nr:hypothetical protein [Tepidisphaeraceae bacterium]
MADTTRNLVAIFDDRFDAERALHDLENAGFKEDQIGMVLRGSDAVEGGMITDAVGAKDARGAIKGAATGAVVGGILAAAAAIFMPGVGPVIAAGILSSFLGGAAAGAGVGGILGAMTGLGVSEDEARYYELAFQSGKAIIAVKPGERWGEATDILRLHGGYNLQNRLDQPVATEGTFNHP